MKSKELFSTENYWQPIIKQPIKEGYKESCRVGADGVKELLPLLERESFQGRFVITDKGNISEFLQKSVGDVIFNSKNQSIWSIEIKTERENRTGNFFLETWSNRSRLTPGWMITLKADFLWYYFQDVKTLYSIHLPDLQKWAFIDGKIYRYPEKEQKRYNQLNDTWGRCVNISHVESEVGLKKLIKDVDV